MLKQVQPFTNEAGLPVNPSWSLPCRTGARAEITLLENSQGQKVWKQVFTPTQGRPQVEWQAYDPTFPCWTSTGWHKSARKALQAL